MGNSSRHRIPALLVLAIVATTIGLLRLLGRAWWCDCGASFLWTSSAWGPETSQHLLDPYSLTHVLHGVLFAGILALVMRRVTIDWRFATTVGIESLWEIVENSAYVIDRYRAATAALGYNGDTILNSMGDIACCGAGFVIAQRLGARRSVVLFLATELVLLLWIRDSLLLNVVMLLYPIDAVRAWQLGH